MLCDYNLTKLSEAQKELICQKKCNDRHRRTPDSARTARAGSIVTKDIPANVVAVGNPCRVMREINAHDREYYYKDRKIEIDIKR